MPFEIDNDFDNIVQIKVIGVGGGGGNAIDRMVSMGVQGVEFISINTDKQALYRSKATQKIQIGEKVTHGKGAGSKPEMAKRPVRKAVRQLRRRSVGATWYSLPPVWAAVRARVRRRSLRKWRAIWVF